MTLYGEGQYELTDIKQVVGTESFLGLSEEIRRWSTKEKWEKKDMWLLVIICDYLWLLVINSPLRH